MALSQFDKQLTVSTSTEHVSTPQGRVIAPGTLVIEVGGPLEIASPEDYEHPILVQFLVVQVTRLPATEPSGDPTREENRVRGVGKEVDGQERWSGTVELGELVAGPDENTETRGVAVAVLERKKQFAFDTITWCDHVKLVNGTGA
jgi:hypothetical protein